MDEHLGLWLDVAEADVAQIRRFDRLMERRTNELQRRALQGELSWAAVLVLQELAVVHGGRSVAWLRDRIDLDRGYLCRVMKHLESRGLLASGPSQRDGRLREYALTDVGKGVADGYERFHRGEALAMLSLMLPGDRRHLLGAMGTIERLLRRHLLPEFSEPWTAAARKRARYR